MRGQWLRDCCSFALWQQPLHASFPVQGDCWQRIELPTFCLRMTFSHSASDARAVSQNIVDLTFLHRSSTLEGTARAARARLRISFRAPTAASQSCIESMAVLLRVDVVSGEDLGLVASAHWRSGRQLDECDTRSHFRLNRCADARPFCQSVIWQGRNGLSESVVSLRLDPTPERYFHVCTQAEVFIHLETSTVQQPNSHPAAAALRTARSASAAHHPIASAAL